MYIGGMSTEQKAKRAPEEVCDALTRDVHSILSVCLHQFKDSQEIDEQCFDVDAIVSGRSLAPKIRFEQRIQPASWSSRKVPEGSDRPYTAAGKGHFIPETHFSPRFA